MAVDTQQDARPALLGWQTLARTTGIAVVVLLAAAGVGLSDLEAGAAAGAGVVALLLLRFRTGLLGLVALGLSFANVSAWMVPAAISNLAHNDRWLSTAIPSALAVAALTGLISVVGAIVTRRRPRRARRGPTVVAVAAGAVLATAGIAGAVGQLDRPLERPGDLRVDMGQVRFDPDTLEADAGVVGVVVTNSDLFWHTFTIRELDVNVSVPVKGQRRVEFDAPAGTYELVCVIPGHEQAGMTGVVRVG